MRLILKPNPFLETDRTSYSDPIQQFPRGGRLRECIVASPGHVLCSTDYNQGEVITWAQACLWIVGWSDLADALLDKKEPHKLLGARMLGLDFDEFCRRFDDKEHPGHKHAKSARQAAKPANFGFPGGMGAPKLALQQRKGGPDTPCASGPAILKPAKEGKPAERGYRGLRFCVLMSGAEQCGYPKLQEWKKRSIPPVCAGCLECSEGLRGDWFSQWREADPYFKYTGQVADGGQEAGLEAGQMVQFVSRIVRGGVNFTACSNGYFQSLLATAAKRALRRAQRECTDVTFRLPDGRYSPLLGCRIVVFQHDECIAEMPEATAHEAASRLSAVMVQALQEVCPDLAPIIKAPPAIMRRWYKDAEPVIHGDRYVVWTPDHNENTCPDCAAQRERNRAAA